MYIWLYIDIHACYYWTFAMKILPVIFILLLLSAGCGRLAVVSRLDKAVAIMDSLPDSALAILRNINPKDIKGSRLNAEYALFMSQALYKNFVDVDDDSLISIASDYYRERLPSRDKMLACFYDGAIKYRMGNNSAAIVSALEAEDIALKLGDYYYLGMIYELLAKAYNCIYGNDDELRYSALALESYRKAGKNDHADFAALNLGIAYNNVGDYDRGLRIFDSIRFSRCKDSDVINAAMKHSLTSLMGLKNYQEIIRRCSYEDSIADALQDACVLAYLSWAYYLAGDRSKSRYYKNESLKTLIADDAVPVYGIFYNIACRERKIDEMLWCDDELGRVKDSIQGVISAQQLYSVHRDYYNQKSKTVAAVAERDKNKLIFIGVVLLSVVLIIVMIMVCRNKRRRQEFENMLVSIQNERDLLLRNNSESTLHVDELLRHKFDTVQSLCDRYFERSVNSRNKDIIYKDVTEIIDSFSSDDMLVILEATLNKYKNNIVTRLRERVDMSKSELRIAIYFMSGFTARSICCFIRVTPSNLYNQKSRLKKKIAVSAQHDAQEFLDAIR